MFSPATDGAASHHEQSSKRLHSHSAGELAAQNDLVTMDLSACASKSRTTIRICVRTMLYWLAFGIPPTIRDKIVDALQIMGASGRVKSLFCQ